MATRATGDPVPEPRLSRAAYRHWAETQATGRFERIEGMVVEVLSTGTRGDDLIRKLVAYFRLPSVHHYLGFWADRPRVIHHRRREASTPAC